MSSVFECLKPCSPKPYSARLRPIPRCSPGDPLEDPQTSQIVSCALPPLFLLPLNQKTRECCGCFRGLFGGSRGKLRESPGKFAGKIFPNREMLQIIGFRAPGKVNLPGTLGRHCEDLVPTFRAGCYSKSKVPAFSSFSDLSVAKQMFLSSKKISKL